MQYYLAPFEWSAIANSWLPPQPNRVRALFDLRPLPARATPVTPHGYGLFAYLNPQVIDGAIDLGDSLTALDNNAQAEAIYGSLSANSVRGLVLEMLPVKSDPTGQDAPKPLMPKHDLRHELIFGDNGMFDLGRFDMMAAAARLKVLAALREDYRAIRQWDVEHGSTHYRRVLGALKRKFRVSDEGIFIPDDLPQESALNPETTVADTFDRADNTDLNALDTGKTLNGSAGTWQWTEVLNNSQIVSNLWRNVTNGATVNVRAEQDLASADQQISGTVSCTSVTTNFMGLLARYSAAADTHYRGRSSFTGGSGSSIASVVAGVATGIGSNAATAANGAELLLIVNGSSLDYQVAGVSVIALTDTGITGNLRAGAFCNAAGANRAGLSTWQADDLVSAQTITANFISSTATVYSPTVTTGAVTVSPNFIASAAQVYSPTVSQGSVSISPDFIAGTATVYSPTVTPGAVTVAPNFIAGGATVYSPTVAVAGELDTPLLLLLATAIEASDPATQEIAPAFISSVAQVYSPTVLPGPVTVLPAFLAGGAVVYSPTVSGGVVPATPASRIFAVSAEDRVYSVPAESRVFSVA